MTSARSIRVRGVVQGVGFRPFVFHLARANTLAGWVLNASEGVEIHLEGSESALDAFVRDLRTHPPPATQITAMDIRPVDPAGCCEFTIRESQHRQRPSVRISPDLPVCDACLKELFDESDRRHLYPYINCTNCGPRYTIILGLPYDRCNTTMKAWPLDVRCASQYRDPEDRRFHAQPVACPECGPHYVLRIGDRLIEGDHASIRGAVQLLDDGSIVAIKGLGGYHLACDAANEKAVIALRERKFRKEKPFALMAKDLETARSLVHLSPESSILLCSTARPIVLAPARVKLPGVAPDNDEFGVMLPYTPLQHLLFACGAPGVLVMTSANRSNEPIAYEDEDALRLLSGIADAFLIGERPIARRVDDSIARAGAFGPVILRRARGYAPGAVASLPRQRPVLALGADLKNTITLVVGGQAFMSQHIGDLDYYQSRRAFEETIHDLTSMYEVNWEELLIVHDQHPGYVSTVHALQLSSPEKQPVQHHRAHLASVLAERAAWDKRVLGVIFDGTGYGDDGAIWGGEIFAGSLTGGFDRVAHLRYSSLAGGDAAARHPVQAAAGFVTQLDGIPDLTEAPFRFPARYQSSLRLLGNGLRTFPTTSMGRLFDTAAALLGFTRESTFEGQPAMWLEHLARGGPATEPYPFPLLDGELDFRPLLAALIDDRLRGRDPTEIARSFQRGIAYGVCEAIRILSETTGTDTVVLSGGVFQNELLLEDMKSLTGQGPIQLWTNRLVPSNDGGISLGQAALASFRNLRSGNA
jgi:hydrogenase maturation protein HypF